MPIPNIKPQLVNGSCHHSRTSMISVLLDNTQSNSDWLFNTPLKLIRADWLVLIKREGNVPKQALCYLFSMLTIWVSQISFVLCPEPFRHVSWVLSSFSNTCIVSQLMSVSVTKEVLAVTKIKKAVLFSGCCALTVNNSHNSFIDIHSSNYTITCHHHLTPSVPQILSLSCDTQTHVLHTELVA